MSGLGSSPLRPRPLTGPRVVLRPAAPPDAEAFAAVLADPSVAPWWPSEDPVEDGLDHATRDDVAVWAIEVEGAVVGLIQAWEESDPEYRHAGIDLGVIGASQGQGLGPEAIRAVALWLFDERGHHRLTIDPRSDNANAIRAYAKVGFRPVGVLREYQRDLDGTWHDGLLMDLLRGELTHG